MAKYKVKSLTMKFGETEYKVRSIPAGKGQACEPVDVTCLDDTESQFIPGALVNNKEFQAVVQGLSEAPEINKVADVSLTIVFNDGKADVSKEVEIPNCILKDIDPPAADATGDRAANWTLTFQPGGSTAAPAEAPVGA
jgi:hypothetical protein